MQSDRRIQYFRDYHKTKGRIYLSKKLIQELHNNALTAGAEGLKEFIPLMLQKWNENPIILPTYKNVFGNPAPAIITGVPRIGKSTSVKRVLNECKFPMLIIDPENEYDKEPYPLSDLETINESQIYNIDWSVKKRLRYVQTLGVNPRDTVKSILERCMLEKEKLKDWVFVIDEAQLFIDLRIFKKFVARAPKWTRKVIVIIADYKELEGLGQILRVPPHTLSPLRVVA